MALMPEGARKAGLADAIERLIERLFATRILSFDAKAAAQFAELTSRVMLKGMPMSMADGMIAAIAQQHQFAVATRDEAAFRATGLKEINPWLT
jgi:toxin FitB